MKRIFGIFCALSFLFLLSCNNENSDSRSFPRVRTHAVSEITNSGALFRADITFSSVDIIDHGFVWGQSASPSLEYDQRISLGPKSAAGAFDTRVERSMEANKNYFVRAYARSEKHLVYGEVVKFLSLGSMAPAISDFDPKQGTWGDTVVIKGKNFSDIGSGLKVKIGSAVVSVLSTSPDSIAVIVPDELTLNDYSISVEVLGNLGVSKATFKLIQDDLVITSTSPDSAVVGDMVTISGDHFSRVHSVVALNGTNVNEVMKEEKNLRFAMPAGIQNGQVNPQVTVLGKTMGAPKIIKPSHVVKSVAPLQAFYGDVITINGNYFPNKTYIKVYIGNAQAEIVDFTRKSLRVMVPNNLGETNPKIVVSVENVNQEYTGFTISPPKIDKVEPIEHLMPGDVITITGDNFAYGMFVKIGDQQHEIFDVTRKSFKIRVYRSMSKQPQLTVMRDGLTAVAPTLLSYSLSVRVDNIGEPDYGSGYFATSTKGYYGLGQYNGYRDWMYEFDPSDNTVDYLAPSSLTGRFSPLSFSLNDKGYVGGGGTWTDIFSDFKSYDPATSTWSPKRTIPEFARVIGWFTNNSTNRAYCVFYSEDGGPHNPVYEYNGSNDTWTKKSDFPGATRYFVQDWDPQKIQFYEHNGKYYALGGSDSNKSVIQELWTYDPALDQWQSQSVSINLGYSFFILKSRGKTFLITQDGQNENWYELDAAGNFINKKTRLPSFGDYSFSFSIGQTAFILSPLTHHIWEYDPNY